MIDQGFGVPQDVALSLRDNFRQWLLPAVFDAAVRSINRTDEGAGLGDSRITTTCHSSAGARSQPTSYRNKVSSKTPQYRATTLSWQNGCQRTAIHVKFTWADGGAFLVTFSVLDLDTENCLRQSFFRTPIAKRRPSSKG